MNIIIVGDGKLGNALAEQLSREGHSIVIVDKEKTVLKKSLEQKDISCVQGNGASGEVLLEAGVRDADILIACTLSDEINMLCCLIGKKLGAKHTIARVRDPEYYRQVDILKDDLGLSMTINPDMLMAREISSLLIIPSANKVEKFAKGKVELVEYKIPEESNLDGLRLAEFYTRLKVKILVCAVSRNGEVHIPNGSFEMKSGDTIYISAQHSDMLKFFRMIGKANVKVENTVIVGGGRTGYYLAERLDKMGVHVKIIEKDRDRCHKLCELLPKAIVINGDGADRELLLEEGYDKADSFIALTNDDEDNMVMSVYAKNDGCGKIITKLSHSISSVMEFGLDSVVAPQSVVANNVASFVRAMENSGDSSIETLYSIVDGKAEAIEFTLKDANAEYLNTPLSKLKIRKNLLIACISRKREVIIPGGDDTLQCGDSVVIVTANGSVSEFVDILE